MKITMSRFKFTGDLELIRPRQLEFISEILEKLGYNGPEATVENVGAAGENYMSTVKRIIVKENGETFRMIAKIASDNDVMRATFQTALLFKNEEVIYLELLPKFIEIQKSAGVETYRYPEVYGVLNEEKNETILLEDLRELQFGILDRFKELSDACVKMVLKNLAVFHSMSYVLKEQDPELFNEIKSKLGDQYNGEIWRSEDGMRFMSMMEDSTASMLSDDYKKYVKGKMTDLLNLYTRTTSEDAGAKYSIIQQGDGWISNIMFKMKDDTPEESILIDYQMSKESNPAFDIMYMIFNSTSHEQRLKNYYKYLDHYHSELDKSLRSHGLTASVTYPREQLDADLTRFGKFMFPMCLLVTNTSLKSSEKAEKVMSNLQVEMKELTVEHAEAMCEVDEDIISLFRKKVEGLVDSFQEFGYL